jgi:peptide/nickel transport system substrate-binding protein
VARAFAGFALALTLAACAAAPSHRHELRLALPLDPTSLSPLVAFSQDQIALDLFWCQTLVGLDERNRPIPILATRIPSRENGDISPDGLRITYHLRKDARFADGVPFTSADVAFTYRAIFDPANAAATETYRRIASLTTPDPHTVVIRLREPWGAAVHDLFAQADFAYGILPKHAFASTRVTGSPWEQTAFGTGPFRVAAWHRGDTIELEPNPYFRPHPKLARIEVRIVPNATAALNALRTHAVDVAELDSDNAAEAAAQPGLRIERTPENGLRAFYFQTAAVPTNDLRVRRAIAAALDVRELRKAWRGLYPDARSFFPAPLMRWPHVEPPPYAHDLAAAARELDAAGWTLRKGVRMKAGEPLTLLIALDPSQAVTSRIAVIAASELAPLGIAVSIKAYQTAVFSSPTGPERMGRFSLVPGSLIGGSDPEESINLICAFAHDGGENYARFCSPRLDAAYHDQLVTTDETRRRRDFDDIARIVHEEAPMIPLHDLIYIEGVDTRVTGYARNMLRFPVNAETWDAR